MFPHFLQFYLVRSLNELAHFQKKRPRFRISNKLTIDEISNKMCVRDGGDDFTVPRNFLGGTTSLRTHKHNNVESSRVQSECIQSGGAHTDRV